jgi:uncharacterized protein (TIGR03435 family)
MIMIPKYLSALWDATAPALANHLWQSTLFAVAAGLLTLALRQQHARIRYWLWLAASVKFLLPFSLLTSLGSYFAWSRASAVATTPGLYFAVEQISQPFSKPATQIGSTTHSIAFPSLLQLLPALMGIWLCGFLIVVFVWIVRWRRISAAVSAAMPLHEGREVGALRRVERIGGLRKPIELLLSRASLEPGIFGITRPVLIWPEGISKRLEDAHLEAILAHEVWHVRRRDNLFAALHMLVEAIFWFHPLVWWLGARLVEERERACDEEVVEFGSDRQVYAESILKVCEFCLGSPLVCVSGVTGADLKRRMVYIMSDRMLHKLDFARKLLLSTAALLAIAIPVTFGLLNATSSHAQSQDASQDGPIFDSVSIKPSTLPAGGPGNTKKIFFSTQDKTLGAGDTAPIKPFATAPLPPKNTKIMFSLEDGSFSARATTLQMLIKLAYHTQGFQIAGGPDWRNTQLYDVDAKLSAAQVEELRALALDQRHPDDQAMLKALLRDHFKLALHAETRNLPVYDLVIDNAGSKLRESSGPNMMLMAKGELVSQGTHLAFLTDQLSIRLGRAVVDKTGLTGNYAFTLRWTPDASEEARLTTEGVPEPPSSDPPASVALTTAVQEQLGLQLEPHIEPVQVLVVDHAEQPSDN